MDPEAPKVRNITAWANGPGKSSFSDQALKARDSWIEMVIARLQRFALFASQVPGPLAQAITLRAFGAFALTPVKTDPLFRTSVLFLARNSP
jgi:hypothetical protein